MFEIELFICIKMDLALNNRQCKKKKKQKKNNKKQTKLNKTYMLLWLEEELLNAYLFQGY